MDFADKGSASEEAALSMAIMRQRQQALAKPLATIGTCRNIRCGDECVGRFCSITCRDVYESLAKVRRQTGGY